MEEFRKKLEIIQREIIVDAILNVDKLYEVYTANEKECVDIISQYCKFIGPSCNHIFSDISGLSENVKKQILYEIVFDEYNNYEEIISTPYPRCLKWFYETIDELVECAEFNAKNSKTNIKFYLDKLKNLFGEEAMNTVNKVIKNAEENPENIGDTYARFYYLVNSGYVIPIDTEDKKNEIVSYIKSNLI